ncbi:MAG: type II secretion system F family protein [Veillonellaceae bacterium]|nr:type II secretion system F family protein [Veillonellaceae bacterium]
MVVLISVAVFFSLMTIVLLLGQLLTDDNGSVERLKHLVESRQYGPGILALEEKNNPKGIRGLIRSASRCLSSLKWSHDLDVRLQQAAISFTGAEFMVICLSLGVIGFLGGYIGSHGNFVNAFAGAAMLIAIPFLMLQICRKRRMKAFSQQLGDALTLAANSLRTGYSFIQAFDMVAREMQPPISAEFARTVKETNLGIPMEDALVSMAKRVNSKDFDLVITSVLIQRQVGGNLAEILDNIARTIRERVRIRNEIKTLTAQGRISGLIVGLLPFGLSAAIYVINPEYISLLFVHPVGRMILAGALIGQLIGILLIRRIVTIEV